jgi:hypothetical protein
MKAAHINIATAYDEAHGMSAAHRDPNEAGSADRYYGRPGEPNFAYRGTKYTAADMTPEQIEAYWVGYLNGQSKAAAWKKSAERRNA